MMERLQATSVETHYLLYTQESPDPVDAMEPTAAVAAAADTPTPPPQQLKRLQQLKATLEARLAHQQTVTSEVRRWTETLRQHSDSPAVSGELPCALLQQHVIAYT